MNFLTKYATLIKWFGIAAIVAAVSYSIYDYTKSKEMIKQLELSNTVFEQRITSIKEDILEQTKLLNQLSIDYNSIELEYSKQIDQINELRQLTEEYIKSNKPEVKQELNIKFDQSIKQIQCLSGDTSKCE